MSDLPAELAAAKERVAEIEKQIAEQERQRAPDLDSIEAYLCDRVSHHATIEVGGRLARELLGVVAECRRARFASEAATETKPPILEVLNLRDLVQHCWVHSAYERCGYDQMTTEQKDLFESITEQSADELLEQIDAAKAVAPAPLDAEKLAVEIFDRSKSGGRMLLDERWQDRRQSVAIIADIIRKHTNQEGPSNG